MTSISRRKFTQSLTTLAASHGVLAQLAFAQTPDTTAEVKPRRIDVHHHILPPEYVATVGEATLAGLRQLGLDEAVVRAIEGENAAALFPRLGAVA